MKWSPQQSAALKSVAKWLADPHGPQVFRIFGYAGSGKTTLARHLAEDRRVLFGAFTGKAASVLRSKGCRNATTIHQMIYLVQSKSTLKLAELEQKLLKLPEDSPARPALARIVEQEREAVKQPGFRLNPDSDVPYAELVIIDECSMVDERMGKDLLSFGTRVLVLGDPAQLPPIFGGGFFTNEKPDVMLTEIHRQARDNPIIDIATKIRTGHAVADGSYGESLVLSGRPEPELVLGCDQILVGKNATRRACNARQRSLLGLDNGTPYPVDGDKLVCLRNNHELGLLNGTLWVAETVGPMLDDTIPAEIRGEADPLHVEMHAAYFTGTEKSIDYWDMLNAESFDYGYALTTHKAQGSQWGSVFVFDEGGVFRNDGKRWRYTAVTRAAERVVLCR